MAKKDLKKELQTLYFPSAKEVSVVDVPPMDFAMVDGVGNPNSSPAFQEAIGALYGISYTLKFMLKKTMNADYVVMPLEALWWTKTSGGFDYETPAKSWKWTCMILQPDFVTRTHFKEAAALLEARKHPPALSKVRLERFDEGHAVQVMHIGPYSAEKPAIERLHAYIKEHGHKLAGKHHEIYMGDPRRTAPARLKTVVRQPFR